MPRRSRFTLSFAPETLDHVVFISRKHHRLIRKELHDQLVERSFYHENRFFSRCQSAIKRLCRTM